MHLLRIFIILITAITPVKTQDIDTFFQSADRFLKQYVDNGSVAYAKMHSDKKAITALYQSLGAMQLTGDQSVKKAFYINAYNLIVIYAIVQHYPVHSPMDIDGFFDKLKYRVAGESLSLNQLEKEKLLNPYKDARLHFALVCAAKSCPPLMSGAYTPSILNKQLDTQTISSINNGEWIELNNKQKAVRVSKIFEWYNSDFTTGGDSLLDWINKYRKVKIPNTYKIEFQEYDWSLNN